jgi:hypothetical protein
MENNCYFVSSRGLLKSCSFHSPKPVSSCPTDIKYLLNMIKPTKGGVGQQITDSIGLVTTGVGGRPWKK